MNDSPCPSLSSLTSFSYMKSLCPELYKGISALPRGFLAAHNREQARADKVMLQLGMELVLPAAGLLLTPSTSGPRAHKIIASRPGIRLGVCQVISHPLLWFLSQTLPPGALLCSEMRQPPCGRCVFLGSLQHFN